MKKSKDQYSEPMPNREIVVSSKDPNFDDLGLDKKIIILNKNERRGSLHVKEHDPIALSVKIKLSFV